MSPPANSHLRRRLRWMTGLSVCLGLAVAVLVGHLLATRAPLRLDGPAAPDPAASQVVPNDPAGARHPRFDCRAFSGPVELGADATSIAGLSDVSAGQRVRTRGRVMAAYPRIMGRNWLHLCDAPGGDVLVVATTDWAHPGDEVIAEGVLGRDRDIGGVYVFPLLIEGGRLEGPAVIEAGTAPGRVIDL